MVSKEQSTSPTGSAGRLPRAFATQPRAVQLVAVLVLPAALGAVAGLLLGVSAGAYWALQAIASIGGLLAGLEHHGARPGAARGLWGGALFGSFLLLVHAISGLEAHASLGDTPILLIVVTGAIGCALGALGGYARARLTRS